MITRQEIRSLMADLAVFAPHNRSERVRKLLQRLDDLEIVELSAPAPKTGEEMESEDMRARIVHLEKEAVASAVIASRISFWKAQCKVQKRRADLADQRVNQHVEDLRNQLNQARAEQRVAFEKLKEIHKLSEEDIPF